MYKITTQTTEKGYTYMIESNDVLYPSRELAWEAATENSWATEIDTVEKLHKAIFHYGTEKIVEVRIIEVCPEEAEEIVLWTHLSEKFGVRRNFGWEFIETMPEWDIENEKTTLQNGDCKLIANSYSSWYSLGEAKYLLRLMDRYYMINLQDHTPSRSSNSYKFLWCRLGDNTKPVWNRTPYSKRAKHNGSI